MTFFAVEVDYYREDVSNNAVLVPRTTFIPSWIAAPDAGEAGPRRGKPSLADAPPKFKEIVARMDEVARDMGLQKSPRRTGWNYFPPVIDEGDQNAQTGVGVYATSRGVEMNFAVFHDRGELRVAQDLLARLSDIAEVSMPPDRKWPAVSHNALLKNWARARTEVIEPYFRARMGMNGKM